MNQRSLFKKAAIALSLAVMANGGWANTNALPQIPSGSFSKGGQKPVPVKVQPDPEDGVPLSGFDFMLMASFAFGMMWIYRQNTHVVQSQD